MRCAIIGVSGQLATELRRRPLPADITLSPPERVDVTDGPATSSFLNGCSPDIVINASAYTAVDRAEGERDRAFAVNEAGPALLADWCKQRGRALIHVSTDYVFDGQKSSPYVETDQPAPLGVYGQSKLAGEAAIAERLQEHVVLRTSWVFSAHGHNFLKTMLKLAAEREHLRVVADQIGRPTAAADLADAVLCVAGAAARGRAAWGTFHFAGGGATSWHGFASEIVAEQATITGKRPAVQAISTAEFPTPTRRPANSVLDTSRFEAAYELSPRSWKLGMQEAVAELLRGSRIPT
ncbi:MAG: dTDP-4-dehydrorhamnose reductase [Myxococcales bacterium]|nr:MAG: dTDP-4-dehydrorhamnose reductase [Myxococcales bacterium]